MRFPPASFAADVCPEDFVPGVVFFVEEDLEVEADFPVDPTEDFGDDVVRVVLADVFVSAAWERAAFLLAVVVPVDFEDVDVVPAFFAGAFAPDACFCAALRVVVDLRLACARRIDSAGSDDFASAAWAASCCATSSERSPRGKKTSEGRPVS